jgi:hypothetical protein
VLREKGFGCEIVCPLSSECFRFVGYAFVDDTDHIQSKLWEEPDQAIRDLQSAIDIWEFSLKTTCGAIVPEETVWWLVSFKWTGTSWSYVSLQDSPGDLYVNDISNQRKPIKRLEAHRPTKLWECSWLQMGILKINSIKCSMQQPDGQIT